MTILSMSIKAEFERVFSVIALVRVGKIWVMLRQFSGSFLPYLMNSTGDAARGFCSQLFLSAFSTKFLESILSISS